MVNTAAGKLKKIQTGPTLPEKVAGATSTISIAPNEAGDLGLAIYVNGGCLGPYQHIPRSPEKASQYICSNVSESNFAFDPLFNTVSERRIMPRKRQRHASIAVNGFIWVLGGLNEEGSFILEVDIYDPVHDVWSTLNGGLQSVQVDNDAIFGGVYDPTVVTIGEHIFLIGGFNEEGIALNYNLEIHAGLSILENHLVYKWKNPMFVARGGASAAAIEGDEILIAGGFSDIDGFCQALSSVERYDVLSDSWHMEESLHFGRAYFSLLVFEKNLYAIGGERRGEFQALDGSCKGEDVRNSLDINQQTPDRILFPVNDLEVMDLSKAAHWSVVKVSA